MYFISFFQKEAISRDRVKPIPKIPEKFPKDEYEVDEEREGDVCKQITDFEKEMFGGDSDSD